MFTAMLLFFIESKGFNLLQNPSFSARTSPPETEQYKPNSKPSESEQEQIAITAYWTPV